MTPSQIDLIQDSFARLAANSGSLAELRTTGENTLVATTAALPWLIVLGAVVAIIVLALRRLCRRRVA